MSAIENTITKPNLIFAEFKAFQDLSYRDVCQLFGCTMQESMEWARGNAPADIDRIALIANKVAEKARLRGMSDTDIQYFEKQKEASEQENIQADKIIISLNTCIVKWLYMSFIDRLIFLVLPRKIQNKMNKVKYEHATKLQGVK